MGPRGVRLCINTILVVCCGGGWMNSDERQKPNLPIKVVGI